MTDTFTEDRGGVFETPRDAAPEVKRWIEELDVADSEEKEWRQDAEESIKRFRGDEWHLQTSVAKNHSRFNILWANTQVLCAATYARPPRPTVKRRYYDADPIARQASEVLQRALTFYIDNADIDRLLRLCTQDMNLPGRAVSWTRYVPQMAEGELVGHQVETDIVQYDDFRRGPGRDWTEVQWVARRHLLTREQCVKQFGEEIGNEVPLSETPQQFKGDEKKEKRFDAWKRAAVWEVWSKEDRTVHFICKECKDYELLAVPDPLKLQDFFPCPRPAYDILSTTSLVPVCEFSLYADQAKELDRITARISGIIDGIRAGGAYDSRLKGMAEISKCDDNEYTPLQDATAVLDGNIQNAIWEIPIEGRAKVLQGLYAQRDQIRQIIYEITGISDIMRGSTDANETLGAQQLKSQYGSLRIKERQQEIIRFARDILRIVAEIMVEHYDERALSEMTGIQVTPEIMALLKNDKLRSYRIDIETDSMTQIDEQADKEAVGELLQGLGSFAQSVGPYVQTGAISKQTANTMLLSFLRRFRFGSDVESAIEQDTQNPQPEKPDPKIAMEQQKMQADQQAQQADLQMKQQQMQVEAQLKQQAMQNDMQIQQQKAAADSELQRAKAEAEIQLQRDKMHLEHQARMSEATNGINRDVQIERMRARAQLGDKSANDFYTPEEIQQKEQTDQTEQLYKQQSLEALSAIQQGQQALMEGLAQLQRAIIAPKKVIRGKDGRMSGVVTELPRTQ